VLNFLRTGGRVPSAELKSLDVDELQEEFLFYQITGGPLFEALVKEWQEKKRKIADQVTLNIGGQKFTTSKATLLQYKRSYFEELIGNQQGDSAEVFIDRDPALFGMVINFLRNGGKMLLDELKHSQIKAFMQELRFYRLPEDSLLDCRSGGVTV